MSDLRRLNSQTRPEKPRTKLNEAAYSSLFIPSKEHGPEAIYWRCLLIEEAELATLAEMRKIFPSPGEPKFPVLREEFVERALSDEIVLDEFEWAHLLIAKQLTMLETLSEEEVLKLDPNMRTLIKVFGSSEKLKERTPGCVEMAKQTLQLFRETDLKHWLRKIRAKLAFQELACAISPDTFIPILVELSPHYLSSPVVARWITKNRALSTSSKVGINSAAKDNLRRFNKAVLGNRRRKPRIYSYWRLAATYENTYGWVKGFRSRGRTIDQETFTLFCNHRKIPERFRSLLLDHKQPLKELILEIMADKGEIGDAKAFRHFQTFLAKIRKKHFGGPVLGVLDDVAPVVGPWLDLPSKEPELIHYLDLNDLLSQVRLT